MHIVTATDAEALGRARELVQLFGHQVTSDTVSLPDTDLSALLPESPKRAYDVHPLIGGLLDGPGIELHPRWAPNVVTTLGRLGGRTVGVIANNPLRLGGCLDATSAEKAARFVRMCDAFGVPLVVVVDVPGYLPGVGQEWDGVVRRGAKLLHAFAEAVVPRVTLITRKAYGGAYIAMNSRALGATRVFAWPGAQVAVMGSVAAVRILHRRTLAVGCRRGPAAGRDPAGGRARGDRRRPAARGLGRCHRRGHRAGQDPPGHPGRHREGAVRARPARQHPAVSTQVAVLRPLCTQLRGRARTCARSPCAPNRLSASTASLPVLPNQCGTRVSNSAASPGFSTRS